MTSTSHFARYRQLGCAAALTMVALGGAACTTAPPAGAHLASRTATSARPDGPRGQHVHQVSVTRPSGPPAGGLGPVSLAGSGVPPYVLLVAGQLAGQQPRVLNAATGQETGRVSSPAGAELLRAAATADDRTFAVAAQAGQQIRFYLLHLDASGRPGPLTPLPVPALHLAQIYGMALTVDATKLAVAWQNQPAGPVTSHIAVTTLATGATRTWSSRQGGADAMSWTGPATLAFDWGDARADRSGIRLLDTATPGTSPLDSRLLVPASTRPHALQSPSLQLATQDGSTLIADMAGGPQLDQTAIARFSALTGQLQAILVPATPATSRNQQNYCGALWASPDGSRLLTQCGATQYLTTGNHTAPIASPRLIPSGAVGWAGAFAW